MAVGQGSLVSTFSYLALGRESTFGTGVTATATFEVISGSPKGMQGNKVLEQIERRRVYSKHIKTGKTVEGEFEAYFYPDSTACAWSLQNAIGGTITSATATGETAGGSAFSHTVDIGNLSNQTYSALTFNMRKGDSTNGKVFEYNGMRTNEYTMSFEMDEALKFSSGFVGKDFTSAGTDVESLLTTASWEALSFVNGRVSVENSFASLTSTSFWHVHGGQISISNNLKTGNEARRIGSDTLNVLDQGVANISMNLTMRFDTTTAIDAMTGNTKLSVELEFQGTTLGTSVIKRGLKFQMPCVYVEDAGDPSIGGPDEQIISEVSFNVLHDASSATGFSLRSILTNDVSSYT